MRKLVVVLLALAFLVTTVDCFAQRKGASERAQERASQEAVFHRVGDWFATVGKSKEEKEKILQERRAEREAKRAAKEAEKAAKKAEKEAKKAAKKGEKGVRKATKKGSRGNPRKTRTRTRRGWELNTKPKENK